MKVAETILVFSHVPLNASLTPNREQKRWTNSSCFSLLSEGLLFLVSLLSQRGVDRGMDIARTSG